MLTRRICRKGQVYSTFYTASAILFTSINAGLDASTGTTLGEVLLGWKPGRLSEVEITVYQAMGLAMEDMVAANLAYLRAKREGGGDVMDW